MDNRQPFISHQKMSTVTPDRQHLRNIHDKNDNLIAYVEALIELMWNKLEFFALGINFAHLLS